MEASVDVSSVCHTLLYLFFYFNLSVGFVFPRCITQSTPPISSLVIVLINRVA